MHPLQVRFPDGKTARSTGISGIALPATAISLPPAYTFEDDVLGQSLFSISDITKQNYTATFHKNGLYLYHDNDLVHYSPKTTEATAWILPIQRLIENANAVISLPSDKKFVEFTNASLGSPVQSTLLRAVRKGYLSNHATTYLGAPMQIPVQHCRHSNGTSKSHLPRP